MDATFPALLAKSAGADEIYSHLMKVLGELGPIVVEEKKTSLHITAGRAAFLGVHPRKEGLRLNLVLARPLSGPRIVKSEQVSKTRFHNELDVKSAADLDAELEDWLREAYRLQK